jgi:hypothetical protein
LALTIIGPTTNAEIISRKISAGQILKKRLMKNLRGSLDIAAFVIKKPEIAKKTQTARKPIALRCPNENSNGSSPNPPI